MAVSKNEAYSDKIKLDDRLKFSMSIPDVKKMISKDVKCDYATVEDKLDSGNCDIPVFPSDYELATLARCAYDDLREQNDLRLPDWIFLTEASNVGVTNGYHGFAYFNAKHQQIVIAHRGTVITNLKAVWNDLKGIIFSNFVSQMNSAITFAYNILTLIKYFNDQGAYLKLSFTGHSLGGWLAQVTTFSAKYLTTDDKDARLFRLVSEIPKGYHAHTVAFDSPGCKTILNKLTTEYIIFRYLTDGVNEIDISVDFLDITTYLSAPNRINCCNAHVGKLYRIFTHLHDEESSNAWLGWLRKKFFYTLDMHKIDGIVNCFDPETGLVRRDGEGKLEVRKVNNWPIIEGIILTGREYNEVIEWIDRSRLMISEREHDRYTKNTNIRYDIEVVDDKALSILNAFNENDLKFFQCYEILHVVPKRKSLIFLVDTDEKSTALNLATERIESIGVLTTTDYHRDTAENRNC